MSSLNEHIDRWRRHEQPRRRVDFHREGFQVPPDPEPVDDSEEDDE